MSIQCIAGGFEFECLPAPNFSVGKMTATCRYRRHLFGCCGRYRLTIPVILGCPQQILSNLRPLPGNADHEVKNRSTDFVEIYWTS